MTYETDPAVTQAGSVTAPVPQSGLIPRPSVVRVQIETPDLEELRELSEYREGVDTLLRLRASTQISNRIPAHASILFEKFFEYAQHHVRILCRNLNATVFGNQFVVEQAKWALSRNVRISVLTEFEPEDSRFCDLLRTSPANVTFVQMAPRNPPMYVTNFTVMDERAIREETDTDNCVATASMHRPDRAKKLVQRFDWLMLNERSGSAGAKLLST